ncbi:MAG: hypothetical protein AAB400_03665 [Patescibacteria group bacterium]
MNSSIWYRALTISVLLGIISGCELPSTINFLSNNTASASLTATGSAVIIANDPAPGKEDLKKAADDLKKSADDLKKTADTIASSSAQASASERVDTSFDEVVGEFSGRIPLRLADGSIGSASVEVQDVVWSYLKQRLTAVFSGDVNGIYSHDEAGKVWEKENLVSPQGESFEEKHEILFQSVNATDSVGPVSSINWEKREMVLNPVYTEGEATTSIPNSLGVSNFPPRYLNTIALITREMTFWLRGNTPQVKRKNAGEFSSLQVDVVKGDRVVWVFDPLHQRVIPITKDDQGRYHLYRISLEKI